jgi:hypothetical protein
MKNRQQLGDSGDRVSVSALVTAVDRIAEEEQQQIQQIKEMEQVAISKTRDFRKELLDSWKLKLENAAKDLRVDTPELVSDAETALVYHLGGMLARNPVWGERFISLENRIKQESEKEKVVPVLLRYPVTYYDRWDDPGVTQVSDCLILVPSEFAKSDNGASKLFASKFSSDMTSEHAFTQKQIPVNRSALCLRGTFATIHGGITGKTADYTGSDCELSRYCLRTDGRSGFAMGDYAYNDSHSCLLYESSGSSSPDNIRAYESVVGWNEIGTFLKKNTHRSALERAVTNVYDILEELSFTDFTGTDSTIVSALRKIQSTRKQTAALQKSMVDELDNL